MSKSTLFSPRLSAFETSLYAKVDSYTLADSPEMIHGVLDKCQASQFLDHFNRLDTTGNKTVYHNSAHAVATALNCYEGALHSHWSSSVIKAVTVAGLFHDLQHSLGEHSDVVNVCRARALLREVNDQVDSHQRLKPAELKMAVSAIISSEYPYKTKDTDKVSQLLRDADLMATYLPNEQRLPLIKGLLYEINATAQGELTMEAFCDKQLAFGLGVNWNSRWARLKAVKHNWPLLTRTLVQSLQQEGEVVESL